MTHEATSGVPASILAPGMVVRHGHEPGWGEGQVQSVVGHRVTVMFPECGKVVIDAATVPLLLVTVSD